MNNNKKQNKNKKKTKKQNANSTLSEQLQKPNTKIVDKGNNKITELRTILQRESQNS